MLKHAECSECGNTCEVVQYTDFRASQPIVEPTDDTHKRMCEACLRDRIGRGGAEYRPASCASAAATTTGFSVRWSRSYSQRRTVPHDRARAKGQAH